MIGCMAVGRSEYDRSKEIQDQCLWISCVCIDFFVMAFPVELNEDGSAVKQIHYDKIISPQFSSQEYGIEDPRISFIDGRYYMTTCCVSSERHSTMLYVSDDGLEYKYLGIVLDHQNKDMLLFEGKINENYYALTRPLGECYFAGSTFVSMASGCSDSFSSSPDLLHWKPADRPFFVPGGPSIKCKNWRRHTTHTYSEGWLICIMAWKIKEKLGFTALFGLCLKRMIR